MSHYFDHAPRKSSAPKVVPLVLPDLTLSLTSDRGVFSADRVDPGTKLLLTEAPRPPVTGALLDLGCGYGAIAVTLGLRAPDAAVWAVDVNERARHLAAANAEAAGAPNVTVCGPSEVPADLAFAALYSNPPVRIGGEALRALLDEWVPRAEVSYLVVHKNLGSDSLARRMGERGWAVERLVSRLGYRVLQVRPG